MSNYSEEYTYPVSGTFNVTKNSGTISVKSSDTNIAIAKIEEKNITVIHGTTEGTTIITVTSASNVNYKAKSVTYIATVKNGTISLSTTPYSGKYDGKAHNAIINVAVDPHDAKIEHSQDGNTYSTVMPTINEATTIVVYGRASKIGYKTQTTKCNVKVEVEKFAEKFGVGYYADTDGDGTVDGVIFADFKIGGKGSWGDSSYTISTVTGLKEYYVSQKNYSGAFGTKDVISPMGAGNARFLAMVLRDYNNSEKYTFSTAKSITSGECRVPSRKEWVTIGGQLGITNNTYLKYKVKGRYWTSSNQPDNSSGLYGCCIDFGSMKIDEDYGKAAELPIRLVRTF